MVRRVGFGAAEAGLRRVGPPAAGAAEPAVERNWVRIVFQALWLDLWLVALYRTCRSVLVDVAETGARPPGYQLALVWIALFGAIIAGRRFLRLLRGTPLSAPRR